jgi:hypothetical protein
MNPQEEGMRNEECVVDAAVAGSQDTRRFGRFASRRMSLALKDEYYGYTNGENSYTRMRS